MASEKDQYANLFGSSDEESGGEEEEDARTPPAAQAPAAPAAPASAAAAPAGSSDESSSSGGGSSDEESEDERPARKRLSKGKKGRVVRKAAVASSSGESSDSEDEEAEGNGSSKAAVAAVPARSRATGLSALDRATADFQEPESSDEEGGGGEGASKPFVARSVTSGSSSGSDYDSSDEEGDSRRRRLQKKKRGQQSSKGKRASKARKAAAGSDESDSDRDRRDSGDRGGGGATRRPGRELTVVEQALQKLKRNRGGKLPEKEVQERTNRLIEVMEAAAKEDRLALAQGRPGLSKMAHLDEVLDLLRSKHLQGALVDNGQLLGLIKLWIQPLPDKSLPLYSVRTPLIEYLVNARVEVHRLKESGIGAVIQKLKKHPNETLENKARLGEIIDNWSRLITGKGTHLKTSMHAEEGRVVSEMNRGAGGGDGYVYAKTARGVEIPIRPGFNFKKVALSFKGMDDRGQGKEDEALEVMEREPRVDGVESRATKVRKALKDMGRKGSGKRLRAENVSHSGL